MTVSRFGGVAGFFVFSQQLLIGYVRLGQIRVNDCPAGLENWLRNFLHIGSVRNRQLFRCYRCKCMSLFIFVNFRLTDHQICKALFFIDDVILFFESLFVFLTPLVLGQIVCSLNFQERYYSIVLGTSCTVCPMILLLFSKNYIFLKNKVFKNNLRIMLSLFIIKTEFRHQTLLRYSGI